MNATENRALLRCPQKHKTHLPASSGGGRELYKLIRTLAHMHPIPRRHTTSTTTTHRRLLGTGLTHRL